MKLGGKFLHSVTVPDRASRDSTEVCVGPPLAAILKVRRRSPATPDPESGTASTAELKEASRNIARSIVRGITIAFARSQAIIIGYSLVKWAEVHASPWCAQPCHHARRGKSAKSRVRTMALDADTRCGGRAPPSKEALAIVASSPRISYQIHRVPAEKGYRYHWREERECKALMEQKLTMAAASARSPLVRTTSATGKTVMVRTKSKPTELANYHLQSPLPIMLFASRRFKRQKLNHSHLIGSVAVSDDPS